MDDLISRQAAIDAIGEIHPLDYNAQAIAERIKELPSAHPLDPCETCLHKGKGWDEEPCDGCTGTESKYEPERKKGKWIDGGGTIACSVCHIIWLYRRTNYCPNCGANMKGEE